MLIALLLALAGSAAMAEGETPVSDATTLVVVFSHAGENYNVGVIEEGNTLKMARIIAEHMSADLFELVPVVPYPEGYNDCLNAATEEQRTGARPEYEGEIELWDQYDTVFIGYPIWWGEIPNIVYTFMEGYDFTGKTIIPFNTHEGSGQGATQRTFEALFAENDVLQGLALRGSKAQNDPEGTLADVTAWLNTLNLLTEEAK